MTTKDTAKCYGIWGRSRYYRTKCGETYSIEKGYKDICFYHGNVILDTPEERNTKFKILSDKEFDNLKKSIDFVE